MSSEFKELLRLSDSQLAQARKVINSEIKRRRAIVNSSESNPIVQNFIKEYPEEFSVNSSEIRSCRMENNALYNRQRYLKPLILQDWSFLYPRDTDFGDYYVYAHVDPEGRNFQESKGFGGNFGGTPFYIGKGIGDRAYDLKRNEGHGVKLRQLRKKGYEKNDIVHIAFDALSEQKAYELEAKLIYFFGSMFDKTRKRGTLVNLAIPKTPDFIGKMVAMPKRKFRQPQEGQ